MRDAQIVDRIRGTLIGGALGDALGWPIEFDSLTQIRDRFGPAGVTGFVGRHGPPFEVTDDTQMTLFTAEGLLRRPPGADVAPVVGRAYQRWLITQERSVPPPDADGWLARQPFLYARRAPGNACVSGLRSQLSGYRAPVEMGEVGPVNPGSKGCGTVMRSAPFGVTGAGPEAAFDMAARCAQLTHGHPTGYLAAGAFAALIDRVVSGDDLRKAVRDTIIQVAAMRLGAETVYALEGAVTLADAESPSAEVVQRVGAGWVAEECLAVAVHCALRAETMGIGAALLLSVNHSGDSDSTGAVAGNLLGAVYGLSALPPAWVAAVEGREVILRVADDLATVFLTGDRTHVTGRHPLDRTPR